MRNIITNEMSEGAYAIAKDVYFGRIGRTQGITEIAKTTGMSEGSASDYISNFIAMLNGKRYTRTLNTYATKYYLENIRSDFGQEIFKKAIQAVEEHVEYYYGIRKVHLNQISDLIKDLR